MGVPALGHVKYTGGGGTSPSAHASYTSLMVDDHPQYATPSRQRSYGYVAGGFGGSTTSERYDDVANSWSTRGNLNNMHYNTAGFHLNGYGYVAGGWGETASVEKYDSVTDAWTPKTNLTTARDWPAGFALNTYGYIMSGTAATGETASVEKYDDVANTWAAATPLNQSKNFASGFSLNGYGYSAGGYNGVNTATTEKYGDMTNAWTTVAYYNGTTRGSPGGFSLNGYGYIAGGDGPDDKTDRYDSTSNAWVSKDLLNTARGLLAGFSLNGYGYVAGGDATVEKYDDVADAWTAKAGMGTSREGPAGFPLGELTETKYFSPEIVNIIRSVSYRAIVVGSYNTSATTSGICNIAHGLGTAPVIAWAFPICTPTTVGQVTVDLKGLGGTNISFVAASCPLDTEDAITSSINANFVWGAQP